MKSISTSRLACSSSRITRLIAVTGALTVAIVVASGKKKVSGTII